MAPRRKRLPGIYAAGVRFGLCLGFRPHTSGLPQPTTGQRRCMTALPRCSTGADYRAWRGGSASAPGASEMGRSSSESSHGCEGSGSFALRRGAPVSAVGILGSSDPVTIGPPTRCAILSRRGTAVAWCHPPRMLNREREPSRIFPMLAVEPCADVVLGDARGQATAFEYGTMALTGVTGYVPAWACSARASWPGSSGERSSLRPTRRSDCQGP
jgi:hypothetical protein